MKKLVSAAILALVLCASGYRANAQVTIRTNLLGDAVLVPNLGFEFGLSKHFTLLAEGYYSPYWEDEGMSLKGWWATAELRYYFCEKFNGHYLGLHGNYGDFDKLQITKKKNIREGVAYGGGLDYGYTWRFNHRWSLDAFIGAGVWCFDADVYCKNDPTLLLEQGKTETVFGLTRLGVSLAYRF